MECEQPLNPLQCMFLERHLLQGQNFALYVVLPGTLKHQQWIDAVTTVHHRLGRLQTTIALDPPRYVPTKRAPIQHSWRLAHSWRQTLLEALAEPLGVDGAAAYRWLRLETPSGQTVLALIGHPAWLDGWSALVVMRALLASLGRRAHREVPEAAVTSPAPRSEHPPQLSCISLRADRTATAALSAQARSAQSSTHGYIAAQLLLCLENAGLADPAERYVASRVDLRRFLDEELRKQLGMQVCEVVTAPHGAPGNSEDVAVLAAQVRKSLHAIDSAQAQATAVIESPEKLGTFVLSSAGEVSSLVGDDVQILEIGAIQGPDANRLVKASSGTYQAQLQLNLVFSHAAAHSTQLANACLALSQRLTNSGDVSFVRW